MNIQPAIVIRGTAAHVGATAPVSRSGALSRDGWGFLEFFILAQVVLPALLYLPGTQGLRVPIRIAPFAISLLGFAFLVRAKRRVRPHPCRPVLVLIVCYLLAMLTSPGTNTAQAGLAQAMLYFSVMAPVFWAPVLVTSRKQLQRIMAILLICNGANAIVGVLQVKFPETFMPKELTAVYTEIGDEAIGKYTGANGETIIRPPGLSDNPGAVCGPASIAALLGLVMATRPIGFWRRTLSAVMSFAGVAAIFLSSVRTSLLILIGMSAVYCVLLFLQREERRAFTFAGLAAGIGFIGLLLATALAGSAITDRYGGLLEEDPATLYQRNRGFMLQDTTYFLSDAPLGAGLGRWGMMRLYFGDESNAKSPPVWAEIQFPAWALDGGIVLIALYCIAVLWETGIECRACLAFRKSAIASDLAVIVAANAGVLALMFSFTPVSTQSGLQYWFLAGVLFGVIHQPGESTSGRLATLAANGTPA